MNFLDSPLFTFAEKLHEGVVFLKEGKVVKVNPAFRKLFKIEGNTETDYEEWFFKSNQNISLFDENGHKLPFDQWPFQRVQRHQKFRNEICRVHSLSEQKDILCQTTADTIRLDNERYDILYINELPVTSPAGKKNIMNDEFLIELLDALPVMITLYDEKFNRFFLNKSVERITGWTNNDLKDRNIMELAYPDPEYRKSVVDYMLSLKKGFRDITMTTKDGRKIETSWSNVRLADGKQVGIGMNIQKQRRAEKTLKDSEERFRNLADNISQLAWMADRNGSIFWYNKRWYDYTGTSLKDVRGYGWSKVYHPDHIQRVLTYYRQCFKEGMIWEDTFPIKSKNGGFRWFLSRALPIRDKAGKITRWFGTNTDITDIQNLQKELLEANERVKNAMQLQKTFIQNISHEVRTPMNSILGFTEMLNKKILKGEEKSYLNAVSYNGKQLLNLIDDIIDFSRLDSKDLHLSKEVIALNNIFDHLTHQFEALQSHYKKHDIKLKVNIRTADKNDKVFTDPYRLQQVMNNLLSNAVKYTDRGFVEIGYRTQRSDDQVLFFVKDTGIGIKEEHSNKIFKRFHQTSQADTKYFKGTGLGLAICKHLVELFNGDIWFESSEGKGSSFYFTHPFDSSLQKKEGSSKKEQVTVNQRLPDLKGRKILVAEDDDFSFRLLEAMISETNAEVVHAETGSEAVNLFFQDNFDLVFLDIRLPGMNGYEVLEKIKEYKPDVPVIAQSAYAMPEEKKKSRESGFDFHATKPISIEVLYSVLNKYLTIPKVEG